MKRSPRPRETASLSDSVHRQLNMYALAASAAGVGVLALSQPADAKIVYTKAHRIIGPHSSYKLDLNRDRITDFTLVNNSWATDGIWETYLRVSSAKGNSAMDYLHSGGWGFASALKQGAPIGPKEHFHAWAPYLVLGTGVSFSGAWKNVKNRYLGLKFQVKGKTHYGWVRLNVTVGYYQVTATLTGYAYETVPGKAIIAGQTNGPDDDAVTDNPGASITNPVPDIPQPATLGALALGAPGLAIWRREESVADAFRSN
jgi:hypothetical protein